MFYLLVIEIIVFKLTICFILPNFRINKLILKGGNMKNLKRMAVVLLVMVLSLVLFTGCAEDDERDPTAAEIMVFATGILCVSEALSEARPGSSKELVATNVDWTNAAETVEVVGEATYDDYEADWGVVDFSIHFINYVSSDFGEIITGDLAYKFSGISVSYEGSYAFEGNTASLNFTSGFSIDGTITINGTTFSASHFFESMEALADFDGKGKLLRFFKVK